MMMTNGTTKPTTLTYGWWEPQRRTEMPTTLRHEKNYVLTVEELRSYSELLKAQQALLNKECAAVALNLNALTASKLWSYANAGNLPRCTTVVDVLTFILDRGKAMKALTKLLVVGAKRRNEAREAQERA